MKRQRQPATVRSVEGGPRKAGPLEHLGCSEALRRTGGNKSQAADILGMKRTTLAAKMKALEATAV